MFDDEQAIAALPERASRAFEAEQAAFDDELRRSGRYVSGEALQAACTAATLRVRAGRLTVTDGPGDAAGERLGGLVVIEARDLNDAIRLAARMPSARFGRIEVRPVRDPSPP